MSGPRGYVTGFVGSVFLAAILSSAVNTSVNPWRVTPLPWSVDRLEPYREISTQIRTAKAGLVRSNPDMAVILTGSSRVANAMDPAHPGWQRDGVFNLGCSGGFFYEGEAMARYAIERRPIERILFGLDPGDFSSDTDTRAMGDYAASPLDPNQDALNREMRYLIGISTLEASIDTLKLAASETPAQYRPDGLRIRRKHRPLQTQRDFIRDVIIGKAEFNFPETRGATGPAHPGKIGMLEALMSDCRKAGIHFQAYFHPTHALQAARLEHEADPPVLFENERREVLEAVTRVNALPLDGPPVELWDFNDHHPLNADPMPIDDERMPHWNDLGHYTVEIGNLIQSRMMDWPVATKSGGNYGRQLKPGGLEAHLGHLKASYLAYLKGPGRTDVEWKEHLIEETDATN